LASRVEAQGFVRHLIKQGMAGVGVVGWIVVIGFVAGIIARLLMPGPNTPRGFFVTTILGIAGALLATFGGQLIGLYRPGQGAGFFGATVGALIILFIWHRLVASGLIRDHGI
jgi:uncharacterized membrane protein YeaQ/YmgE (transglycosylase-associated protein family)